MWEGSVKSSADSGHEGTIPLHPHTPIDDVHHGFAVERCAHRINVYVQVRHDDAELQDDRPVRTGELQQHFFRIPIHLHEAIGIQEFGKILDMLLRDDHRMPADRPVLVKRDGCNFVFVDELEPVKI